VKILRFIRWAAVLLAMPALLLGIFGSSSSASAASPGVGWVRLAHFSPNTPAVDVYLYSFDNSAAELVLHHVAYGTVSPYETLSAGDYTVAMRPAGAAATSAPAISASLTVVAGHSYTVAGLGPESGLRLAVLDDQITTPPGKALVRVIQASLQQHVVTVSYGGQTLVHNLAFGSVTSYQTVTPATETVLANGPSEASGASIDFAAGTVHTLVILDGSKGLVIDNLVDAAGSKVMPSGGAATGFGGTAPRVPSPLPWLLLIAAGVLVAAGGGLSLRWLPRSPA
jgi:Domain of unknown function (DUF4397)